MHSIYVALVIIFPTLHVMVMQNHISGWSNKSSLEYKLHVPISDIYCICIHVSHDLLVLSKHTKHGHCPISRFFTSVSSLILFLSSTILRFSSLFHCLFYCNMLLNGDDIRCVALSAFLFPWSPFTALTGLIRFAPGSLLTASWGRIFGDREPQRWFLLWCWSRYLSPG